MSRPPTKPVSQCRVWIEFEPAGKIVDCPVLWATQVVFPDSDRSVTVLVPEDAALKATEVAPAYAAWSVAPGDSSQARKGILLGPNVVGVFVDGELYDGWKSVVDWFHQTALDTLLPWVGTRRANRLHLHYTDRFESIDESTLGDDFSLPLDPLTQVTVPAWQITRPLATFAETTGTLTRSHSLDSVVSDGDEAERLRLELNITATAELQSDAARGDEFVWNDNEWQALQYLHAYSKFELWLVVGPKYRTEAAELFDDGEREHFARFESEIKQASRRSQ